MAAETQFVAQIQFDFVDILHANRLYRASTSDYIVRLVLGFTLVGFSGYYFLIAVLFFIGSSLNNQPIMILDSNTDWIFIIGFVLGLIALFDLVPLFRFWVAFRQNPRYYAEQRQATLTDNKIELQGQGLNVQYQWNYFFECIEGHREFVLVHGKDLYLVIPKKGLPEIDSFRDFIKSKVPKFRQKLKIFMDFPK